MLDQSNRTKRNMVAGLISDTWTAFKNTGVIGQAIAGGAVWDGVKLSASMVVGIDYAPLIEFIAANGAALQSYVAVAFSSFPNLPDLVERIGALWSSLKRENTQ